MISTLLGLSAPSPEPPLRQGNNPARRQAWRGIGVPSPEQGQLELDTDEGLPPLQLIVDWTDEDGEPLIHVGLPSGPWGYRKAPRLHWRVSLPDEGVDIGSLTFGDGDGVGSGTVLDLDTAEFLGTDDK